MDRLIVGSTDGNLYMSVYGTNRLSKFADEFCRKIY